MVSPGPVAFSIGGFEIMWYGFLIGTGFLSAALIAYKRAPLHDIKPDFIMDLMIWLIPSAIIGARAYYVIFKWEDYSSDLMSIFRTREGGLAIHGALILCFIVAYFLCKAKGQSFVKGADLAAVVIPLGQAIGRWGNFFNEEAHGIETDLPWAQIINGVGYHPTFLYESLWCLFLFLFLLWFDTKKRTFDGQIIALYMMLYSLERFFVEGLRTDSLMIGFLRQAQVISIVFFLSGLVLYVFLKNKKDKNHKEIDI